MFYNDSFLFNDFFKKKKVINLYILLNLFMA